MHRTIIADKERPDWLLRGKIPCLDGLRAVAILLVLLAHWSQTRSFPATGATVTVLRQGAIGVDIFFVLSGFLITVLLMRELGETKTVSLKEFYLRRVLRIIPAFATFVLVIFALTNLGFVALHPGEWISVLTYTVNWISPEHRSWEVGHLWSLSIEEHFYLIWPLLLLRLEPRRARRTLVAYLAILPAIRIGARLAFHDYIALAYSSTLVRMDSIAVGCVMALCAFDPAFRRRVNLTGRAAFTVGLLAMIGLAASMAAGNRWPGYALVVGDTVNAVTIAIIIWLCVHHGESIPGRLLRSRPLATLGVLSYSLYLWQQLFLNRNSTSWICQWPWNMLFAAAAGVASYVLIETPFLRIKDRISHNNRLATIRGTDQPQALSTYETIAKADF